MAQQPEIKLKIRKTVWYYVLILFSMLNTFLTWAIKRQTNPGIFGIKTIIVLTGIGEPVRVMVDFKRMEVVW